MIRGNPPPKGKRLSAAYLKNQHENDRSQKLLPSDQYSIQTSTRGTVLVFPEAIGGGGGFLVGVVTDDISACTGVYPSFAYGVGGATILGDGSGAPYSSVVYSTFRDIIPASAEPAIFGITASGKIFFINGNCPS